MALHFTIGADHPALPGHFPGAPVVPGVVVLDHVMALRPDPGVPVEQLAWVKFVRPLLPGQRADVTFTVAGDELRFSVAHAGTLLVRGAIRQRAAVDPP